MEINIRGFLLRKIYKFRLIFVLEKPSDINETMLFCQVDTLKRKLDKLEAAEETKETGSESSVTSARSKLPRYSSLDSIGLNSSARTKIQSGGEAGDTPRNEEDVFEMNNNSGKSEIGGYKLSSSMWYLSGVKISDDFQYLYPEIILEDYR